MTQSKWTQLIDDLRNGEDVNRAVKACEAISTIADESHIPELYALLQDEGFFVREAAADPLARLEGLKALPLLFQALTRGAQDGHDNDGLAFTIVELLKAHKAAAAPILLDMLTATHKETRANAAWALGFVKPEVTAYPLLAMLNDHDASVRSAAAGSLGGFKKDPQVTDALLKVLQDGGEHVRISAASALGYLGDKRAIEPLKNLLNNCNERSRPIVEYGLKQLGNS
jgi:HEAT repeat protein